jgi:hypothetical protein
MIELHQFPPVFHRNISPFTLKLEAWLRLAGLPYETGLKRIAREFANLVAYSERMSARLRFG